MFERGKKDEAGAGRDFNSSQDTAWQPASSAVAAGSDGGRSRDVAVIGRSIHIDGDLRGEEDLRIEGDVKGTIHLRNSHLTIGKEGKIHADVYAKTITVDGLMEGDLYGAERVGIRANARVRGNITAPRVSLEEGARFKGAIEMDSEAVEAAFGKQKPTSVASVGSAKPHGNDKAPAKPEATGLQDTVAKSVR